MGLTPVTEAPPVALKSAVVNSDAGTLLSNVNVNDAVDPACEVPGTVNEDTVSACLVVTVINALLVALAGALPARLPPERTLVAFKLNLNEPFVLVGGVAEIVIPVPAVAVELGVSKLHPV